MKRNTKTGIYLAISLMLFVVEFQEFDFIALAYYGFVLINLGNATRLANKIDEWK